MDILDTGLWAAIAGASFLLLLLFGALGSFLEPRLRKDPPQHKKAGMVMMLLMLGLCILLALSLIPLMVITVLGFQEVIGNRDIPAIGFLIDQRPLIILALWAIIIGGSLLAIPAMLNDLKME